MRVPINWNRSRFQLIGNALLEAPRPQGIFRPADSSRTEYALAGRSARRCRRRLWQRDRLLRRVEVVFLLVSGIGATAGALGLLRLSGVTGKPGVRGCDGCCAQPIAGQAAVAATRTQMADALSQHNCLDLPLSMVVRAEPCRQGARFLAGASSPPPFGRSHS